MIEVDVTVGGVPVADRIGKEITVNFYVEEIDNDKTFYTDSNGLEMQLRELNYRPMWKFVASSHHNVSVNYYPVTSAIVIRELID